MFDQGNYPQKTVRNPVIVQITSCTVENVLFSKRFVNNTNRKCPFQNLNYFQFKNMVETRLKSAVYSKNRFKPVVFINSFSEF